MFGLIVFRGRQAVLLHTVMTQLSCWRAPPQSTVFKGGKQVHSARTPSGEMKVSMVATPVKTYRKGILKIMTMHVVVCTALLSVTLGTLKAKTVIASWRDKSNQGQGCENTGLLLQIVTVAFIWGGDMTLLI